ncbi:MAG: hypothetical protein QOH25_376 [Acidobacteriota bacterium]|nr:hypothetical protein [Acidobacteriota bacterium]
MKNRIIKNVLLGIVIALVATYLFPGVLFFFLEGPKGLLVIFSLLPLYGLFYTFWLVIPLGVALGMLIPRMASGKDRWTAALHGAGFGALAGLVSVFCFTSVFRLGPGVDVLWISVIAYCALWVGGYAFYCARGQSLYR